MAATKIGRQTNERDGRQIECTQALYSDPVQRTAPLPAWP